MRFYETLPHSPSALLESFLEICALESSKAMSNQPVPNSVNEGSIIRSWQIRDLEGRILTLLETLGLSDKQEDAVKSLARQAVWKILEDNYLWISDEQIQRIYEENRPVSGPVGSVGGKKNRK